MSFPLFYQNEFKIFNSFEINGANCTFSRFEHCKTEIPMSSAAMQTCISCVSTPFMMHLKYLHVHLSPSTFQAESSVANVCPQSLCVLSFHGQQSLKFFLQSISHC